MGLAVLVGFGLRLWNIGTLQVYGDGAYSVYLAGLDPVSILRLTAQDSHPPVYYLLLWLTTGLAGASELTARLPSIAAGLIVIPLTYAVGARTAGRPVGLIGAWLVALSPFLIYYSRFPRMYTLLAALGLLSAYLLVRYLDGAAGRWWAPAFGATLWLAVHVHYFGAVLGLSEGILLLLAWRRGYRRAGRLLTAAAVAALASLPWLTYGFLGAARFTASNIANAPAPDGLGGFLEQFSVPFHAGPLIDVATGRLLLAGFGAIGLLLLAIAWWGSRSSPAAASSIENPSVESAAQGLGAGRPTTSLTPGDDQPARPRPVERLALLAGLVALPLLLTFAIFLIFPYFARHRFLAFSVPFYLLLVAAGLAVALRTVDRGRWTVDGRPRTINNGPRVAGANRPPPDEATRFSVLSPQSSVLGYSRRIAGLLALVGWLVLSGWALVDAYRVEPLIYEPDAVRLNAILTESARPGDLVVFQAAWQFGYLRAHYQGPPVTFRSLDDLGQADLPDVLTRHPRIWLAMYQRAVRDPDFPLEQALDERLAKVFAQDLDRNRLALYVPPPTGAVRPVQLSFADPASGAPMARLTEVRLPDDLSLEPGQALPVTLRWEALGPIDRNLSVFLHLDALDGRTWSGRDAEPRTGLAPTSDWRPGQMIDDPRGLLLPDTVPPGSYRLTVGLYDPTSLEQLTRLGDGVGDGSIAEIVVGAADVAPAAPEVARAVPFAQPITLTGWSVGADPPRIARSTVRRAYLDNPIDLHWPKLGYRPGEAIDVTLVWRPTGAIAEDYTVFVHLIGADERPVAQQDNPPVMGAYPTSRWQPGTTIVDPFQIQLPKDLAPGRYRLIAGLYHPATGERLATAPDWRGRRATRVELGTITVLPPEEGPPLPGSAEETP